MALTAAQNKLIKRSWGLLKNIDPLLLGDLFYSRLFLKVPALRKMFPASMDAQYSKLIDMLSFIVSRLERIDEISEDIRAQAIRHVKYGVKTKHYAYVGDALLWTLESALGNDWNAETAAAWKECYRFLSGTMISAAAEAT